MIKSNGCSNDLNPNLSHCTQDFNKSKNKDSELLKLLIPHNNNVIFSYLDKVKKEKNDPRRNKNQLDKDR